MAGEPILQLGPRDGALAVVLVHGRNRTPGEMAGLARRLELPEVRFVFPEASGGSWYPKSFLSPLDENEPALGAALRAYASVVDGLLAEGLAPDRIVIGGFSQGACLTAEFLVRQPRRYGGAIIWTGGLIGPAGTAWPSPPALRDVPVLLTGSLVDEWVPAERVRATEAVLRAAGADLEVEVFPDRPHEVGEPELVAARRLLAGLARGARAAT